MATELTKIGRVELRGDSALALLLDLSLINDVRYLRDTSRWWAQRAAEIGRRPAQFNWVSVYNFSKGPYCEVYTLHLGDGGHAQALMQLRYGHVVRCDDGDRRPLVYVSFLEVAPWNRSGAQTPRIRGLGSAMLRAACDFSMQRGFDGRLGLHSIADAEGFYRRLGFQGLDCPNEYHEMYFELDTDRARSILAD